MRRKITGVPCKKSEEFPRKKQKKNKNTIGEIKSNTFYPHKNKKKQKYEYWGRKDYQCLLKVKF